MNKLFLVLVLFALTFSCSNEQVEKQIEVGKDATETIAKKQPDPAENNKKKIMFKPTVEGTYAEKLASMEIVSAHAKPVSLNWDFGNEEENLEIVRVVIYEKGKPTQWIAQTSTSGWRGFWVAQSYGLEAGKTYVLFFDRLDVKVEFIMPSGKI